MVYTTKKYLKELKINPPWEIEPHFWDYCIVRMFRYFRTISENKISSEDFQSAMYGEFVLEGKPMLKGFIPRFNSNIKFLRKILK